MTLSEMIMSMKNQAGADMSNTQPFTSTVGNPFQTGSTMIPKVGGGVAGSGLLDPEEFNLAVKDKLKKKDGKEDDGVRPMGGLLNLGDLPEMVRAAVARLGAGADSGMLGGGGMTRPMPRGVPFQGMPEQAQGDPQDQFNDALRSVMSRSFNSGVR